MGIADMLSLIDQKLEDVFHQKPYDPTKSRNHVLGWIERSRSHFAQSEPVKGRKWISVANGVVAFTPTRPDSGPLEINGKTTNFIPVERFGDFLTHFEDAVKAGDFDHALKTNGIGTSQHVSSKPTRKRSEPGEGGARGWSDDRRQRYQATIAARNGEQVR